MNDLPKVGDTFKAKLESGERQKMIRRFNMSDIDQVMKIWLETNQHAHDFISTEYWESNMAAVKEMIPQAEVFVYLEERKNEGENVGEILGFIGVAERAYLAGLFVQQDCQSKGIGSQLLNHCKRLYPQLVLDVYVKNHQAVFFYKKHAFTIQEEKKNEGTGEMEYRMVWELAE